jgi:hypothetical protein
VAATRSWRSARGSDLRSNDPEEVLKDGHLCLPVVRGGCAPHQEDRIEATKSRQNRIQEHCSSDDAARGSRCDETEKSKYEDLETVEGPALPLQGIDDIKRRDRLASRVLCVRDRVADHVFEEVPKNAADFFVDIAADTLHAATSREPPDGGLGDALNVFPHDLAVTLRTTLAKTFTTFAATGHFENELIMASHKNSTFAALFLSKMAPFCPIGLVLRFHSPADQMHD